MHTTSLEVSKRLFEVSGWKGSEYKHCHTDKIGHFILRLDHPNWKPEFYVTEAYDSGYLLGKLPNVIVYDFKEFRKHWLGCLQLLHCENGQWFASYDKTEGQPIYADTPEDALGLLAIKLFEEGVLK